MKIVIHGTYGGYKTVTPEKTAGLFDVRPDPCKEKAVGQETYSVHFNDGDVIFSKYKIIRDGIGDLRTGNIAFSVIIPDGEKLAGSYVKELLDELEKSFFRKNNIKDDYILSNVSNNWTFIADIKNTYETKLEDKPKLYCKQGERDAAFIYYSSDMDLQKYLDSPARQGYYNYKQIFFVQENLKDKPENPLNALRHSENDLTSEISPEPPKPALPPQPATGEPANSEIGSTSKSDSENRNPETPPNGDKINRVDEEGVQQDGERTTKAMVFSSNAEKSLSNPRRLNKWRLIVPGVIVIISVSVVMILSGIRHYNKIVETKRNDIVDYMNKIDEYVKGGEFLMDTLKSYRDSLEKIDKKVLKDTVEYNEVRQKIDTAIDKRGAVDTAAVGKLKEFDLPCCGNSSLTGLKNLIDAINSDYYEEIGKRLDKRETLSLDSIVSSINEILIQKEAEKKEAERMEAERKEAERKKNEDKKNKGNPTNRNKKIVDSVSTQNSN